MKYKEVLLPKQQAIALIQNRQFEQARVLYSQICAQNTEDAEAWFLLGAVNGQLGLFEEAIACCLRATAIFPDYADAYYNMGAAYAGQGEDVERAVDYFQRAIAADARFTRAYVGLGWLHLLQKREPEEALAYFEKAVETAPESTEGYHGLGLAYALTGKRALALKPISMLRTLNRPDLALAVENALRGEFGDGEAGEEAPKGSLARPT